MLFFISMVTYNTFSAGSCSHLFSNELIFQNIDFFCFCVFTKILYLLFLVLVYYYPFCPSFFKSLTHLCYWPCASITNMMKEEWRLLFKGKYFWTFLWKYHIFLIYYFTVHNFIFHQNGLSNLLSDYVLHNI